MQQLAIGCIVQEATFNLGANIATATFTGVCLWVGDSVTWSQLTVGDAGRGGIAGAFPAEPASPVTNGSIIAGFTGQATLDTNVMANIRTATVKISTGNAIPTDVFGSYYGGTPEGDIRTTTLAFSLYDDDSAGSSNLYVKALTKAAINSAIQVGKVAGNIYTINLKGLQLSTQNLTEGQRKWQADFSESRAAGSGIGTLDEIQAVLT
jgi:hypothetical protein